MLTPQELQIIQYGKTNGKSKEDTLAALNKYRQTNQTGTPIAEKPQEQTNPGLFSRISTDLQKRGENTNKAFEAKQPFFSKALQLVGQGAGFAGDILTEGIKSASNASGLTDNVIKPTLEAAKPTALDILHTEVGQMGLQAVKGGMDTYNSFKQAHPEAAGNLEAVINIASILPPVKATQVGTSLATTGAGIVKSTIKDTSKKVANVTADTIENIGSKIATPSVSNATRVSLNPRAALKGTGQDIQVSVGGKLKKLSELTPDENTKMQFSTEKSINKFTQEAEKFKNNRLPKHDPTEIVGNRVDAALNFADKKRMAVGKKMGEIELKYADQSLPIGDKPLNHFSETLKSIDNPKYGVDTADAPIVKKLVQDFDNLEAGGATISDRMDFVRSWDKYLNDSKDAFGNFKENATVNTRIQGAVKTLKDETVDAISAHDKVYRGLRGQYSTFKKLDEIGNRLLGKDGALGDRIRGGATVKRALKSNSDAGARQFLTQLKELTGYDAIKDGDLALTAMENVGDFQGLSLLEVLKQGKSGLIGKGLEGVQNKLVGSEAVRVKKFIKKGSNPTTKPGQ